MLNDMKCRAYFRDRGGIEHGVFVDAINRYHAFGLASIAMRKCSWVKWGLENIDRMSVQLLESKAKGSRFIVSRDQFEAWLDQPGKADEKERTYLKMALGRIPPSRDFNNHAR